MVSYKNIFKKIIGLVLILLMLMLIVNWYVKKSTNKHIITDVGDNDVQVAMVLGAYVHPDGRLCDMLEDRVKTAVELYQSGQVKKILMTGDHGQISYDEVNSMRLYAEKMGIPPEDIFMDHAGFSTYDSMYRARDIFCVNSTIIVTQQFHLPRAIYIARKMGIDAKGIKADKRAYYGIEYNEMREMAARNKDFINTNILKPQPKFLGEVLSITGDGRVTHD
jgi:SanA protein